MMCSLLRFLLAGYIFLSLLRQKDSALFRRCCAVCSAFLRASDIVITAATKKTPQTAQHLLQWYRVLKNEVNYA